MNSKDEFQRIDLIGTWRAAIGCEEDFDEKWPNYSRKREEARSGRRPTMEWNGEGLPTRFPSNATGVTLKTPGTRAAASHQLILFHSILPSASRWSQSRDLVSLPMQLYLCIWHASEFTTWSVNHFCVAIILCVCTLSFFVFSLRLTEYLYFFLLKILSSEHVSNINYSSERMCGIFFLDFKC